jgi:hypothetical protein
MVPDGGVKATLTELELATVEIRPVGALGDVVTTDDAVDETDTPPELEDR